MRHIHLRRVMVTGATGLLGSNVVRELLSSRVEVVAVVRDRDRGRRILGSSDGLQVVMGDVLAADAVTSAMREADAVIHTAAYFREYYRARFDTDLLERTNVAAVKELSRAAEVAGVPVLVHVSSAGTLGPTPSDELADEDTPPGAWSVRNRYFASKVRADQLVAELRKDLKLHVPVVVPSWMWGPGDAAPSASGQMFLSVAHGQMPGVPRVASHIVDARDVARSCVRAAEAGQNRRYVIGGQKHQLADVCSQVAQLCAVTPPRALPPRLVLASSAFLQFADHLRGRPPLATTRGARVLIDNDRQRISSERARRELGVTFRPIAATLADEARWFRDRGQIPPATAPQEVIS